jgi:nicotinamidase/pyrazinamidase
VQNTQGAAFAKELALPDSVTVIRKGCDVDREAYSAFDGTDLLTRLGNVRTIRVFIGGLATEYCVRDTARDALRFGFETLLLRDAVRAINADPEDGDRAETELAALGAIPVQLEDLVYAG